MKKDILITDFLSELSSSNPTPGGGGVAALAGALSASLCSMVANLTSGKKKYAIYQADIERIISTSLRISEELYLLIEEDAKCFEPLSRAYSLSKDDPNRDEVLENALRTAASCPARILDKAIEVISLFEELAVKGSRLALSDVGVAATLCDAAIKSSLLNIKINTKLMRDRTVAESMNKEYINKADEATKRCDLIYQKVTEEL